MRTPSIYSQDDPFSEALKPPATETEAERIARLAAEAEAKRVSEKIDEDLREERERLRRKKGDVKVCSGAPLVLFWRIYSPSD
jgi:guanine nucleotide-binding protein subunit alpha